MHTLKCYWHQIQLDNKFNIKSNNKSQFKQFKWFLFTILNRPSQLFSEAELHMHHQRLQET